MLPANQEQGIPPRKDQFAAGEAAVIDLRILPFGSLKTGKVLSGKKLFQIEDGRFVGRIGQDQSVLEFACNPVWRGMDGEN